MKHKKIVMIAVALSALAILLRLIQLIIFIDEKTGLVKNTSVALLFSVIISLVFAGSVGIIFITSSFLGHRKPSQNPDLKDFPFLNFMTFFFGAFCLVPHLLPNYNSDSTWNLIGLATSIFSCLFFILRGISFRSRLGCPQILSIAPILMFIFYTVKTFIDTTGMVLIIENVIKLVALCAGILFFASHGKVVSEVNFRTNSHRLYSFGLIFFFFSVLYSIPPLIFTLLGKINLLHGGISFDHFTILIAGIYALSFTLSLYSKALIKKHKKTTETLDITTPETSTDFYQ